MPLSEFHRGKPESNHNCSSDLSPFMPDNEFAELLWENGRIVMQGQSIKPKKTTFPTPFPCDNIKVQEKEGRDAAIPKIGFFETMDSSMANINDSILSVPVPSGLHPQVDDMDPWTNYQAEEDPFCSEFFFELSGIPNSLSNDRNNGLGFREGQEPNRSKSSQLFQSPQQCQTSIPSSRPRVTDLSASGGSSSSRRRLNSLGHFQKPLQVGGGVMNFSSFSRPVTCIKANGDHIDRLKSTKEASAAASTIPVESTLTGRAGVRGGSTTDLAKKELVSAAKPPHVSVETSEAFVLEGTFRNNHQNNVATYNKSAPEAIVASSVCSGSSPGAGAGSNDAERGEKRKNREANESGYLSEDLEDDSFGAKRPPTARAGTSTKRSRAAQVHNLSERRRRDRINEKMRALQELIPNCNKVDKASMLDEAIEYLKTLQLQVQMMSMRSGLCVSPMMLPPGMQHFRAPPMAHFSPMGLGMGMGYGMGTFYMNGSPGCPIFPVPPVQAPQFPFSPISMRRAQLFSPFPGLTTKGNSMKEVSGTMVHPMPILDADPSSGCKDQQRQQQQQQNMNLDAKQKTSTSESQV